MLQPEVVVQPIKLAVSEEAPAFLSYSVRGNVLTEFQWVCDVMRLGNPVGAQLLCRAQEKTPEAAMAKARNWCREKGIYGE